jgi:beta-lactamase class A
MSEPFENLRSKAAKVAVAARYLDDFSLCFPAECHPEETFPAASVIKIGIMSCLLDQVQSQTMTLGDRVSISASQQVGGAGVLFELEPDRDYSLAELCRLMMVVSDNTASNALARHLGLEPMNDFWAKRGYASTMRRYFMDPVVAGRDNQMSALSAAMMLRDLYSGLELSHDLREFAVGCLRRQQYREKIPLMLPDDLVVGHKTGELDGVRHDAAVIETSRPYILVVLTAEGSQSWLVDSAIAQFSLEVYQNVRAKVGA